MLKLAVFLGNYGYKYKNNRHNAGWMLAEVLPFLQELNWQNKFKGLYSCIDYNRICTAENIELESGETLEIPLPAVPDLPSKIHFLLPETFMNRSGESAQAAAVFFKIKLDEIIVIHDEIELPFGNLSLKYGGGLGGHNGLRSMKDSFGSADFWRLRIGIGRPDERVPGKGGDAGNDNGIAGWVLSDFSSEEAQTLVPVFNTGARLLLRALATGPQPLLPEWARKRLLLAIMACKTFYFF